MNPTPFDPPAEREIRATCASCDASIFIAETTASDPARLVAYLHAMSWVQHPITKRYHCGRECLRTLNAAPLPHAITSASDPRLIAANAAAEAHHARQADPASKDVAIDCAGCDARIFVRPNVAADATARIGHLAAHGWIVDRVGRPRCSATCIADRRRDEAPARTVIPSLPVATPNYGAPGTPTPNNDRGRALAAKVAADRAREPTIKRRTRVEGA